MEGDDISRLAVFQTALHLLFQRAELFNIAVRIGAVLLRVSRVRPHQAHSNVIGLPRGIGDVDPKVGVFLSGLVHKQRDSLPRIHNLQGRQAVRYLFHKALHAGAVDDKNTGPLQIFHILVLQLVIMQAAGLLPCHVIHLPALNALCDVQRHNIHGVKRRHDPKALPLLRRTAAARAPKQAKGQTGRNTFFKLLQIFILQKNGNAIHLHLSYFIFRKKSSASFAGKPSFFRIYPWMKTGRLLSLL